MSLNLDPQCYETPHTSLFIFNSPLSLLTQEESVFGPRLSSLTGHVMLYWFLKTICSLNLPSGHITIKHLSNSIQSTCGYGPGPRHVGQQNYHQRPEELPQVSSPHHLRALKCQESSLPP